MHINARYFVSLSHAIPYSDQISAALSFRLQLLVYRKRSEGRLRAAFIEFHFLIHDTDQNTLYQTDFRFFFSNLSKKDVRYSA